MRALLLCLLCFALPAHADSYISRLLNKPVPGGVAVLDLGSAKGTPTATYQNKPVLVVHEQGQRWLAIVGLPLTSKPGSTQNIVAKDANGSRTRPSRWAASATPNSASP